MGLFDGTSLEQAVICPQCRSDIKICNCEPPVAIPEPDVPPAQQRVKVFLEKRKRGKILTVVKNLSGPTSQIQQLLTELKTACGAGGTIGDNAIEVQGDHQTRIIEKLKAAGYKIN